MNTVDILKTNVRDLQEQLTQANKRIAEIHERNSKLLSEREYNLKLIKDTSSAIKDLKIQIKGEEKELIDKIQKQIDDWPEVLDSKPKNVEVGQVESDESWLKTDEWNKFENDK